MRILKGHWQLILLTALVFAFWQTPALTPLKILVVFFHEAAHAFAAIATGGKVTDFMITRSQGGHVWALGGNRFVILTAGYLGSLLIGLALLVAATRTKADRWVMAGVGAVMLLISILYIRTGFALSFSITVGVLMLLSARYFTHAMNDMALRVIGLSSMIYVPYDIFSDTIARSGLRSDARMLASEFGGTTMMWGLLWLLISLVMILGTLRYGLGRDSNLRWR